MTASEMKKYKLVEKKGEGTFSEVVKAQNIQEGTFHAIKCMKASMESIHQVNNLREIQALRKLTPHANIVALQEVLYDEPSGRLAMVFELMDANLYDLIRGRREHLDPNLITNLGYQLFTGLLHMHANGIFHRDIKPENILIDETRTILKLADLGSCRGVYNKPPFTEYIATRWYRSPECLLTDGHYGAEMDIWGAGTVMFEIISLFPLFPGSDEVDQINRIHKIMGTPNASILAKLRKNSSTMNTMKFPPEEGIGIKHFIPHASASCINLLTKTLIYDFSERITAKECLAHPYFEEERVKAKNQPVDVAAASTADVSTFSNHATLDTNKAVSDGIPVRNNRKVAPNKRESKLSPKSQASAPIKQITTKTTKPIRSSRPVRKTNNKPADQNKPAPTRRTTKLPKLRPEKEKSITRLGKQTSNATSNTASTTKSQKSTKQQKSSTDVKTTKPERSRSKYANITSSGYGSSAYKPNQPKKTATKKKVIGGTGINKKVETASTAASSMGSRKENGNTAGGAGAASSSKPKMRTRMDRGMLRGGRPRRLPAIRG